MTTIDEAGGLPAENMIKPVRFSSPRGHVTHHYEVQEDGLHYNAGTYTAVTVPWKRIVRLIRGRGASFGLVLQGRQKLYIWLSPEQMPQFIERFFSAWGRSDRERASKLALDYGSFSLIYRMLGHPYRHEIRKAGEKLLAGS